MVMNVQKTDLDKLSEINNRELLSIQGFLVLFVIFMVLVIPWIAVLFQWINCWTQDININWGWYFDWVASFSPKR